MDPLGRFLLVTYGTDSSYTGVMAFRVDATTGALVAGNYLSLTRAPSSVSIDPTGHHGFVAMKFGGLVEYDIDQSTGNLTQTKYSPIGISDLVFDPAGKYLYASQSAVPSTLVFELFEDGTTQSVEFKTTSGFPTAALAMDPLGDYLYAADGHSRSVNVLRTSNDGRLTEKSVKSLGNTCTPAVAQVSPSGFDLYVGCDGSGGALEGYAIDRATGALSAHAIWPANIGARAITFVELKEQAE